MFEAFFAGGVTHFGAECAVFEGELGALCEEARGEIGRRPFTDAVVGGTESADEATRWWHELGRPVVVKLDGPAAGKGVIVPADAAGTDAAIGALAAQGPIVVEERLVEAAMVLAEATS